MAVAGVGAAASPAVEASAAIISWSEPDGLDRRASHASIASHVTAAQALSNATPTAAARSKCPMVLTAGSRQGVVFLSRKAKSPHPGPFVSEETADVTTGGDWIDNLVSLVLLRCEVMWCPGAESNHRHCDFQSHALPTELPGRHQPGEGCNRRGYRKAADGCPALYAGFTRRPLRPKRRHAVSASAWLRDAGRGGITNMNGASIIRDLDLRGLKCPMPVLRTRRALAILPAGTRLDVLCTDPLAMIDLPHLLRETGDALLSSTDEAGCWRFSILKA